MTEIVYNMANEYYHADKRVCSSLLKAALLSDAHIEQYLSGKKKTTDSLLIGTAVHAYYLERVRFNAEYKVETELYARKTGEHNVGDPKLDEDGDPLQTLTFPNGDILKGEAYKRFKRMCDALDNCDKAKELLDGGRTEVSIFTDKERVRPDLITNDGWIVDLKTIGGVKDMALEPSEFARDFFNLGYDLQMYMYWKNCEMAGLDVKGFIFLCVDGGTPAGVRIFYFEKGSDWLAVGKHRYEQACKRLADYKKQDKHLKYSEVVVKDLPIPYNAINVFEEIK